MESSIFNNSGRFKSISGGSKQLFNKHNKLPALRTVCLIALVFVSVAAGVSIIVAIKCAMALPGIEAKLNQCVAKKPKIDTYFHSNISLLLNNLKESNKIQLSELKAKLNQYFDQNYQNTMEFYTNMSSLVNELMKNNEIANCANGNVSDKNIDKKEISRNLLCYNVVLLPSLTWYQASKRCRHLGGFLAEVPDYETMANVNEVVPISQKLWLGASKHNGERCWKWDRSQVDLGTEVNAWYSRPYDDVNHGDCLLLIHDNKLRLDWGNVTSHGHYWNDEPCSDKHGYICQKYDDSCNDGGWILSKKRKDLLSTRS